MPPLLSIVIPSRRPWQLEGLFENIENTVSDPTNLEVVVKVDDDVKGAVETMEVERKRRPFRVVYVCTPRHGGVFTLWAGQNEAFKAADPKAYFLLFASDELRFDAVGWDRRLAEFKSFFADDIFRLRISECRFRNYHTLFDCTFMPESFAIMTRRWLEVAGGTGHCWGTDAFHQCVAYHLSAGPGGIGNVWRAGGHWRDVQVHDFPISGVEFGRDISAREQLARSLRIQAEWSRLASYNSQLHFAYLARRLSLYIKAHEMGLTHFWIEGRSFWKEAWLWDKSENKVVAVESFALPRRTVWIANLQRNTYTAPRRVKIFLTTLLLSCIYPSDRLGDPMMPLQNILADFECRAPVRGAALRLALRFYDRIRPKRWAALVASQNQRHLLRSVKSRLQKWPAVRFGRALLRRLFNSGTRANIPAKRQLWEIGRVARPPTAPNVTAPYAIVSRLKRSLLQRIGYPTEDVKKLAQANTDLENRRVALLNVEFGEHSHPVETQVVYFERILMRQDTDLPAPSDAVNHRPKSA
jgi:hypothetical protein